jgi:hypothetical protein
VPLSEQSDIEVIRDHIALDHLKALAESGFGDLVKAVVDVEGGIMARSVEDPAEQQRIVQIVGRLVE